MDRQGPAKMAEILIGHNVRCIAKSRISTSIQHAEIHTHNHSLVTGFLASSALAQELLESSLCGPL